MTPETGLIVATETGLTVPPNTIVIDVNEDYHDRPEISRSMLSTFIKSRRLYEALYVTKTISQDFETDAMAIGTLTHQQLLEPHISNRIVVPPPEVLTSDGKRTGNKYKAWLAANPGVIPMKQADVDTSLRAVQSVNKTIGMMINHPKAEREKEIYWTDQTTGLKCRAKMDLVVPTRIGTHIVDVKTCADLDKFQWQVRDGLWLQPLHYVQGFFNATGVVAEFWFCVVEKTGTFDVQNFKLSDFTESEAGEKYTQTMIDLSECYESGDWSNANESEIVELNIRF